MLAGAKQEGTNDVGYSRNQPSVLEDDREPQRQRGARSGAQHTSNPKRVADFRGSQVCNSRPPRCTGQMTLGTAPVMVLGTRWPGILNYINMFGSQTVANASCCWRSPETDRPRSRAP